MVEEHATDVVVIGGGAVGENVAERVVKGGLKVIMVEAALVGGECSYWACMPSKALLRPGTALLGAQSVAGAREAVTGTLAADPVFKRRDSFTSHWQDDSQIEWADNTGIDVLRGRATVSGAREVQVAGRDGSQHLLRARQAVVLATGSKPVAPPVPGLSDVPHWGTREATSSSTVPDHLLVMGGGVAGAELAQAYARLGANVTLVARGELLGKFPEPARKLVAAGLRADGVDLRTHTDVSRVGRAADGKIELELAGGRRVSGDQLLVALGRKPSLAGLGLEELGLDVAALHADPTGRVAGVDGGWLYAVGDAAGKVMLTHQGKYEARATGDAISARAAGNLDGEAPDWSKYAATADVAAVPQVVFTDPEVAMVGRTLEQARDAGINANELSLEIAVAGSSLHADNYKGWAQLVVDEDRRVIVGATFAGPDVAELLHAATIAVVGEVPLDRLWHAVPSYPTISEVWLRLLEACGL
ncbi:NAD(P)/FAD-dependent oxidoreductase [Paenarthrobacter sp. DKR-5]|uniref:dihydrolipoyl dehydrogenase family protein n=1 Tax=Paenarthrobacter sp. DKR-5 TaxID=2835535 RepID=UPI001BDC2F19|nr:NAD(P)/FAD-dependent oxidoreductase [Paenarthrobacter sp. DKR-5]MBT1003581.1 NAD(P)/FAD-dependent oxidoreductase [Paenarthrobacter sp. DKR-5]